MTSGLVYQRSARTSTATAPRGAYDEFGGLITVFGPQRQADHIVFRGCTNANISAGAMGIPSLIYGPGNLALAHKPNEHLDIEELLLTARCYGRMIELAGQYQ
jgi:acetylornithine deacetylase/succinyl-diaminopimelate desuccinylase-like protein